VTTDNRLKLPLASGQWEEIFLNSENEREIDRERERDRYTKLCLSESDGFELDFSLFCFVLFCSLTFCLINKERERDRISVLKIFIFQICARVKKIFSTER